MAAQSSCGIAVVSSILRVGDGHLIPEIPADERSLGKLLGVAPSGCGSVSAEPRRRQPQRDSVCEEPQVHTGLVEDLPRVMVHADEGDVSTDGDLVRRDIAAGDFVAALAGDTVGEARNVLTTGDQVRCEAAAGDCVTTLAGDTAGS